jgi:hypothetical protein
MRRFREDLAISSVNFLRESSMSRPGVVNGLQRGDEGTSRRIFRNGSLRSSFSTSANLLQRGKPTNRLNVRRPTFWRSTSRVSGPESLQSGPDFQMDLSKVHTEYDAVKCSNACFRMINPNKISKWPRIRLLSFNECVKPAWGVGGDGRETKQQRLMLTNTTLPY